MMNFKINGAFPIGVSGSRGITLIEMLVAIAVTGILSGVLLQVIRQTTQAVGTTQAQTRLIKNLSRTGLKMGNDIRGQLKEATESGTSWVLIGVDGDGKGYPGQNPSAPGQFEVEDQSPGRLVSNPENVDHFHMHAKGVDARRGFFLNDGDHGRLEADQWGLLWRDGSLNIPYDETDLADLSGTELVGFNIDYLSIRYYDDDFDNPPLCEDEDGWFHTWRSDDMSLPQIRSGNGIIPGYSYNDYPDAIEFAIRGYDPSGRIDPQWFVSSIDFTSGTQGPASTPCQ